MDEYMVEKTEIKLKPKPVKATALYYDECGCFDESDYDINNFDELHRALWHIAFQDDADTCDSKFILRFEDGTIKEVTTKRISEETLRKELHNTEDVVND